MGGSLGGNKSDSAAKFSQNVWSGQQGALKDLYSAAANLFGGTNDMYSNLFNNLAGNLTPQMQGVTDVAQGTMEDLASGGSYGDTSEIRNQLLDSIRSTSGGSNLGNMYNSIVGGSGNTYIDPMVDAMKESSMENLNRMQAGTGMQAAALGQGGSSRHAMQNAMQARDINRDMLDRETMMRGGAYDKDLQMKLDIARQADQGIQSSQDRLMSMLQGADQNKAGSIGLGSNVQGLGMGTMAPWMQAMQMPWYGMGQYANIIGGPTILGSGKTSSSSKGGGAGGSIFG